MPGWVGAKQRCSRESEVGTSSLLQAQPEDFLSPKDEEQKLGNSVSTQPPSLGTCPDLS